MSREFLKEIVDYKKSLVEEKKEYYRKIKAKLDESQYSQYGIFKKAISKTSQINLIAEIKKASPSAGVIRENFDFLKIARTYLDSKAAAISILTEDKYFLGKPSYVNKVLEEVSIPILVKDFIVDEGQIYEARVNGASAVLLIVAILSDEQLQSFIQTANKLDLDCLVEVHDKNELDRAIGLGAEIIGVNNRNLDTLKVNLQTSHELLPLIPEGIVKVAESGISTHEDIVDLQASGANAVLIGETFMRSDDIADKIKEIMG